MFFFQAEDGIRDYKVTGVQTCALPISNPTLSARQPWAIHWERGPNTANPVPKESYVTLRTRCDRRNFNLCVLRQARDLHCRASRRRAGEKRSVDLVHLPEVIQVLDEDSRR